MNIFFLSTDARVAARALCDKHVVKMLLELCQLLWCAFHVTGEAGWESDVPAEIKIYKKTHAHHPMAIWVRKDVTNFKWATGYAFEICAEYRKRYKRKHACEDAIVWMLENLPRCDCEELYSEHTIISDRDFPHECSPPPLAITNKSHIIEFNGMVSLTRSYINYYIKEKVSQPWFCYKFTHNPFVKVSAADLITL